MTIMYFAIAPLTYECWNAKMLQDFRFIQDYQYYKLSARYNIHNQHLYLSLIEIQPETLNWDLEQFLSHRDGNSDFQESQIYSMQ